MKNPPSREELDRLVRQMQCDFADDPNIRKIGWGLAERSEKVTNELAIIFWVKEKIASERGRTAKGTRTIPGEVAGVPTDVQVHTVRPLAGVGSRGSVIADPLNGGWNSSNADEHTVWFNSWGTLGLLCTDNNDGSLMALSNWHVWADGADSGDTIIQPAHPRPGEHVESVFKVLACGPLLTSLLEWESPDPLAAGLYGAAAAAAIAAACSDYKDPIRRGQEATPTAPQERTNREAVTVHVEYPDVPIPGTPFRTDVKWHYERTTDVAVHAHAVAESQINAQFLLGKYVTTEQSQYHAGDVIRIHAALWDYQPRPCDAYHVVAHLIPDRNQQICYPVVLVPTRCPRKLPDDPPRPSTCYDFGRHKAGETFASPHTFDWLACHSLDRSDLIITDWLTTSGHEVKGELYIPRRGLGFRHNPGVAVRVKVATFTSEPITLDAYDTAGNLLGTTQYAQPANAIGELFMNAEGIAATRIRGGGGEGVVIEYCIDELDGHELALAFSAETFERLDVAHVRVEAADRKLRGMRCCYTGMFQVPPSEPAGRWTLYLTAQNVNTVPQGTEPTAAAAVIGGHLVAAPVAHVAACAFMMLGDHVFDIF